MNETELKEIFQKAIEANKDIEEIEDKQLPDALNELYGDYGSDGKQPEGYLIEQEDQFGGEGHGDTYCIIFSVKQLSDNSVAYVKFNGYYSSNWGHEFDGADFEIVKQVPVQILEWKRVAK